MVNDSRDQLRQYGERIGVQNKDDSGDLKKYIAMLEEKNEQLRKALTAYAGAKDSEPWAEAYNPLNNTYYWKWCLEGGYPWKLAADALKDS